MKITKSEALKLLNQHKHYDAVSFNALTDKNAVSKKITALLNGNATVLVIK